MKKNDSLQVDSIMSDGDDDENMTFNRDEENLSNDGMDHPVKVFESVQLPRIGRYGGLNATHNASI